MSRTHVFHALIQAEKFRRWNFRIIEALKLKLAAIFLPPIDHALSEEVGLSDRARRGEF
jgi:hypothetical protein